MLNIILEGADNSGKTTLANALRENSSLTYFHPGGPPGSKENELACMVEQREVLYNGISSVVMDRCTAISQQVYAPETVMNQVRKAWLTDVLATGTLLVYCRPGTDWLMSFEHFTWRDGESEEHKKLILEKQHTFIERYDAVMHGLPHIGYDYRNEDAPVVLKHLKQALAGDFASEKFLRTVSAYQFGSNHDRRPRIA